MKQGVIAFLVVLAGTIGMFVMLGLGTAPVAIDPIDEMAIRLNNGGGQVGRDDAPVGAISDPSIRPNALLPETSVTMPAAEATGLPVLVQPSDTFRNGLAALATRDGLTAIRHRDALQHGSTEWETLSWAIAVSGQVAVPSRMIAETQAALKDWPSQKDLRENFEEALYRENPSSNLVITAFGDRLPQTADGAIILARAAFAAGDKPKATQVVRNVWVNQRMDVATETKFITEFGALLVPADHKRRMDFLLFSERYDQAKRFADLSEAQSLYKAFAAVGENRKIADKLLRDVDAKWRKDPAFLYIRIKRNRQLQRYADAASLLEQAPQDTDGLVVPGAWWNEARIVSRALMSDNKPKAAYRLAEAHVAREPADIAEAEFHAGWFALRGLNDTAKARTHFEKLLKASDRSHDKARAYYWLGRTAATTKDTKADSYFKLAADYPATFYGQLAAARLKIAIKPGQKYQITDADRLAFASMRQVAGISLLEQGGELSRARRLYLALAASLIQPVQLQLLAEKALAVHGPTLALAIGKAALRQGHDPGMAAFPLGAIPDTADVSGAGKALAYAIARQESAFNPQAVSPANARGLLQLLPSTAKRVASQYKMAYADEKLTEDPAFNATLGSHYLNEQIGKFDGSLIMTFAAYNAGPNRVAQWLKRYGDPRGKGVDAAVDWVETIPFTETRDYVQRIMENYQVYKMLLGEKSDIALDLTAGRQ